MMTLNAHSLATRISAETGLEFRGSGGRTEEGSRTYQLIPADHPVTQTFTLDVVIGWRSVEATFHAGSFAGQLLKTMGHADSDGRSRFRAVLTNSREEGADIALSLNGSNRAFDDLSIWAEDWRRMELSLRKGMLPLDGDDGQEGVGLVCVWASRIAAATVALLPLEPAGLDEQFNPAETIRGLPEGARLTVQVNRYERDSRNRAAALAIHGYTCKACDVDMQERYGDTAAGLIEIHHTTPVSQLGPGYIVDPRTDLVPLCPNCHAVAHRRSPPFAVAELRALLRKE